MNKEKVCRTRLLSDTPAADDQFGGAHQRVARAMADMVLEEQGGRVVGLEGGWGSGKSTVINIFAKLVESATTGSSAVIIFDAWAHQGDPLRRTFLEKIILLLEQRKWVEHKRWKDRRDELSKRRRIVDIQVTPKLDLLGRILAFFLVLLPIASTFLGAGWDIGVSLDFTKGYSPNWPFIIGLVIGIVPPLILFANFRNPKAWALVTQQEEASNRTETVETPDPTSIEFEESFGALMEEGLSQTERRIVLVLDNLDRVDASDAISVLSTLQTFLQHSEQVHRDWLQRLWIMIPYDPSGIQRLWQQPNIADAFIAKRFQVRFRVPPLMKSDWHLYLGKLLREAMPDHLASDFHAVYRVFDNFRASDSQISPTPRQLKAFVNQLGTIHRQWGDTFPLAQIAFLCCHSSFDTATFIEGFRVGDIADPRIAGLLGENLRDNLSAMIFNLPAWQARQILLRDPVEKALADGNAEQLASIASEHTQGFWETLQSVPFGIWAQGESGKIANSALALRESRLLETISDEVQDDIRLQLWQAARQVKNWHPVDGRVGRGLAALCTLKPLTATFRGVLESLSNVPNGMTKLEPPKIADWIAGVLVVLRELQTQGNADLYQPEGVQVPTDVEGYLYACISLMAQDPNGEFWAALRPQSLLDVVTTLQNMAANGSLTNENAQAIRVITVADSDTQWSPLIDVSSQRLQASANIQVRQVGPLLTALWELKDHDPAASSQLAALGQAGHLLHYLHRAQAEGLTDIVAACAFIQLYCVPGLSVSLGAGGDSNAGLNYLREVVRNPNSYSVILKTFIDLAIGRNELSLLLRMLDASGDCRAFVVQCILELRERKVVHLLFTPDVTVQRWEFLQTEFSSDFELLVGELSEATPLAAHIAQTSFEASKAPLYLALVRREGLVNDIVARMCVEGLKSLGVGEWQVQLKTVGPVFQLAVQLQRQGIDVQLSTPFRDAVVDHGRDIATGNATAREQHSDLVGLLNLLPAHSRKMMRTNLLKAIEKLDGDIQANFFDLYGNEIADEDVLKKDDELIQVLFLPLLIKRNVRGLHWIVEALQRFDGLLANYSADYAIQELRERTREVLATPASDDLREVVIRLAHFLGVHVNNNDESPRSE